MRKQDRLTKAQQLVAAGKDQHEVAAGVGVDLRTIQRYVSSGELEQPLPSTKPRAEGVRGERWYICVFFAHNGVGPYPCFFCNRPVTMQEVHVHHADHDHANDEPSNLKPCHVSCHMSYHGRARRKSVAVYQEGDT